MPADYASGYAAGWAAAIELAARIAESFTVVTEWKEGCSYAEREPKPAEIAIQIRMEKNPHAKND